MNDPAKIVARGALSGHPVEDFVPIWESAAMRIARSAWIDSGLEVFLQLEVPYGATSSGRLSNDAVQLLLETGPKDHPCRFLEIGAGSGLFAKLFLDMLKADAPEIYRDCTYILTDANANMLASLAGYGVLAEHADHIETRVFDASAPWPEEFSGRFDSVFGSYILDSLPVDFLSVGESGIRIMEARCTLPTPAPALEEALKTPGFTHLAPFLPLAKNLGIQTRHVPAPPLPYAESIDVPEGDDIPMVHCHGALACIENIANALAKGGFAMLSDYGTTAPREPSDVIEFQNFGASAANAVNFHQLDGFFAGQPMAYLKPEKEEGFLISRVLYNGAADDLAELVDLLFGEVRQKALRLPVEAAREMLRANAFQAARKLYAKAMELQPQNWSLAEEVAELLLLAEGRYRDAIELSETGLALNPLSPSLHRIIATAHLEMGETESANAAIEASIRLYPTSSQSRLIQARILAKSEEFDAALVALAHGLAADKESDLRESLIALQEDILQAINQQARDDLLTEVNRTRALDGLPL